jgi:uncharacterized protein
MSPGSPYFIAELVILLLAIGVAGGFLSGLLGVGGGILFVPALYFCLTSVGVDAGHAMHVAVGSSLAIVFATGATSATGHYRRGAVDMALVRLWGPFIVGGVVAGFLFASAVPGSVLKAIFAGLTLLIAFYMAFTGDREVTSASYILPLKLQRAACTAIGMVSSMIGVGGAILTVPLMSVIGTPMPRAVGTGAALGILISFPGMLGYMATGMLHSEILPPFSIGFVNLLAVGMIIPASMLLAPVGVKFSHTLDRRMLRRVFAVVLVIVSLRMFMTL